MHLIELRIPFGMKSMFARDEKWDEKYENVSSSFRKRGTIRHIRSDIRESKSPGAGSCQHCRETWRGITWGIDRRAASARAILTANLPYLPQAKPLPRFGPFCRPIPPFSSALLRRRHFPRLLQQNHSRVSPLGPPDIHAPCQTSITVYPAS